MAAVRMFDGRESTPFLISSIGDPTIRVLAGQPLAFSIEVIAPHYGGLLPSDTRPSGPCDAVTRACTCYRWVTALDGATVLTGQNRLLVARLPALDSGETTGVIATVTLARDVTLDGKYAPAVVWNSVSPLGLHSHFGAVIATNAINNYCRLGQEAASGEYLVQEAELDGTRSLRVTVFFQGLPAEPLANRQHFYDDRPLIFGLLVTVTSVLLTALWMIYTMPRTHAALKTE